MLQNKDAQVKPYAFLLSAELEDPALIQRAIDALVDSLRFMEGTGAVEAECLGELQTEEIDLTA